MLALRERLRKTGALSATDRPKVVPLTHYILFKYDLDWKHLVNTKVGPSALIYLYFIVTNAALVFTIYTGR